jgi:asparagine synthase (glutamine-hydrolysing)
MFLKRPLVGSDIELARAGTEMLAHRGPDGTGEWVDREAGVYLGHRRLAIIDVGPESNQPLHHGGSSIVANGEIYNFKSLRSDLTQHGERFKSKGDMEVLLAAWNRWGEKTLDRVDGMFSFAIWDGKSVHLATDPFGEKPLIWAETEDGVYVSSELKPLVDLLNIPPEISDAQWSGYMNLGYFSAPDTAFRGVYRFPAGHYGKVSNGSFEFRKQYWTTPLPEARHGRVRPLEKPELVKLRDALAESLEARLISDVPLALFLSAGVDSPLIASLAAKELGVDLSCLTVAFRKGDVIDESVVAIRIAEHLGLDCKIIDGGSQDQSLQANDLIDLYTEPSGNTGIFPLHLISRAASKEVKVALSGIGGDEIVWGYQKHEHFYRRRHMHRLPNSLRQILRPIAQSMGSFSEKFTIQAQTLLANPQELMIAYRNYPAYQELKKLPGHQQWLDEQFPDSGEMLEYSVPAFDINKALPNDRLHAVDLASMRSGLEIRTPYLSRNVVNTIAEFDARSLLAFGQKSILRRILGWYVPEEFTSRPKTGFTFPLDIFLSQAMDKFAFHSADSWEFFDRAHKASHQSDIWKLISIRLLAAASFHARYTLNKRNV